MTEDSSKAPARAETRPGLGIQVANRSGLRQRLDKVDNAPSAVFLSSASRVRWAKETFGDPAAGVASPTAVM